MSGWLIAILTVLLAGGHSVWAGPALPAQTDVSVLDVQLENGLAAIDVGKLDKLLQSGSKIIVRGLPLPGSAPVDLDVERFRVTAPDMRFVVGSRQGDTSYSFNPDRVTLLRGGVVGEEGSHVFLAFSEWGAIGWVSGYADRPRLFISSGPSKVGKLLLKTSNNAVGGAVPPGVPLCAFDSVTAARSGGRTSSAGSTPLHVTQQIEMAVETDYEFFSLFGDLDAAAAYVVTLYGAMSDIFLRDVNTRVELSFVRLWDSPDDLFNGPNPIGDFRGYWNNNMGDVHRDVAQFLSGRRDFPYGGAAYLSVLCGQSAYSVVGYILGFFSDAVQPGVNQYDIFVTAHELGHNAGTLHTHDYGIDTCNNLVGSPRRGTIMSYCSQTRSGGNANSDLRFHAGLQGFMHEHIFNAECVADDCNGNGIDDSEDISNGDSTDADGNGIPDECDDCNGNGTLDSEDIAAKTSADLNGNGVPDECEADCNGNGVPDDLDILDGLSADLDGNNIPDSCQSDCDDDGESDYNQIQADMSLDIDRDALLDACQDCDGDGTSNLDALGGAGNAWIASFAGNGAIYEVHAVSGVVAKTSDTGWVSAGQDVLITPSGRIFVSSADTDRVVEFNYDGSYAGDFVTAGSGGLDFPTFMASAPNGNLLVCSRDTDSVMEYDGGSGAFVRAMVAAGSGGLAGPTGIIFGPNGNLFVASSDGRVLEYDGKSGAFAGEFVSASDNGGLSIPKGILFRPDGNLLVASFGTNEILEYDAATGAFVGKFNDGGTDVALTLDQPWGVRIGPDGYVYVSRHDVENPGGGGGGHGDGDHDHGDDDIQELHVNSTRIYVFHPITGIFIRSYVLGHDTQLFFPTGFDFMPNEGLDCNSNQIPDSCDIASGASADRNGNGKPDECECPPDQNHDGVVGPFDLATLLGAWGECPHPCVPGNFANTCSQDVSGDCTVGPADLAILLASWGECP